MKSLLKITLLFRYCPPPKKKKIFQLFYFSQKEDHASAYNNVFKPADPKAAFTLLL